MKRIITITLDVDGDNATGKMKIVDEKGNDDFAGPSLQWLAMARMLSRCESQLLDRAAECVQADDIKATELYRKLEQYEKDNV